MYIHYTGIKTDVAIAGEGFFVIGDFTGGNREYTRMGHFMETSDGYLATKTGKYVLGWDNGDDILKPIKLPTDGLNYMIANGGKLENQHPHPRDFSRELGCFFHIQTKNALQNVLYIPFSKDIYYTKSKAKKR